MALRKLTDDVPYGPGRFDAENPYTHLKEGIFAMREAGLVPVDAPKLNGNFKK